MIAAEHDFRLDIPDKEGHSARTALLRLADIGQERKELNHDFVNGEWVAVPEVLDAARYLLVWFSDLATDRRSSGYGPLSLSSGEILAWAQGKGLHLRVWEFDLMRRLDRAWMKVFIETRSSD